MRISDWSSDVCSSDLRKPDRKYPNYIDPYPGEKRQPYHSPPIDPDRRVWEEPGFDPRFKPKPDAEQRRLRAFVRTEFQHPQFGRKLRPILRGLVPWRALALPHIDRKSVVWGKRVSVGVVDGGGGSITYTT